MDVDIYGDLDNLDNQFEVVQKENEQLKDTVQKLEETSIKFSIEINELKRINGNLEVNISSLYKTAKAEIERKNKQIAELRKELDNMLFKRDPKRKVTDINDGTSQENKILTKQFEKAQHDIDQKNRIIQSLNSELDNVRKELDERNKVFKRYSSQIEEENENHFKAKKPKLEKETFIENEEDYRKYRNRYEMRENNQYNQRSKSPNYRRYNSRGPNDLRSRIDLKRINYRRSRSRSREDFRPFPHNKTNNRQNYRDIQFKGRYTERSTSPLEYSQNYRFTNTVDDERQNYFSEQDSGVFNSQTTESSYIQESMTSEPSFSVSPVLSHDDIKFELEEGELNNTNVVADISKSKKNTKPSKLTDDDKKKQQEKNNHDNKRSAKTNVSVVADSNISVNKIEKCASEKVISNTLVVAEPKLNNLLTTKVDGFKSEQELAYLEKFKETLKNEIKELGTNTDKKELKSSENVSCTNTEKLSKTKNEKIEEVEEKKIDTPVKELIINKSWEIVEDEINKQTPKIETQTEAKICSEMKSSKDNKEKSKSDKKKVENSVSEKKSDLKFSKEKTKLPSKTESKSTKLKEETTVVKSTERILSEPKSTDIKTKTTSSESKDKNISIVSILNAVTNKKEKKISESSDTNIKIVSQIKPNKIKREKKISESNDTNISIVSILEPSKTIFPKAIIQSTETSISVVSVTKNVKNSQCAESNLTMVSEMRKVEESDKNNSDISKVNLNIIEEKTDKMSICGLTAAAVTENSNLSTYTTCPNLNQKKLEISNKTTISSIPSNKSSTLITEEKPTANFESQNIETTAQLTDRKPPIRGRRRRCIISIT